MNALRCLRGLAPAPLKLRNMSLLTARRPLLPSCSPSTLAPGALSSAAPSTPCSATLDVMAKISASPAFAGTQIRCGPRDTYNPSHIVRKRRHGFLSRLRTKKGRKLLMRRLVKGRGNLSH
ncbi:uncharacterized protein M421DRAFT_131070 [Didymella exigua CBS 183.55]|uniref:Large ribosomal subunit protein bL34m n=1 Tax=Didymella exigua CBS 183.55 TaxID=1150837 RepID=A0A6A5RRR5_9PLEO|nr:uncharacterized protein M421DRAFT_131070 [Didymella exigua CBS 183.55]KAF1929868.1 hypothetical protein M421DRAFT_131070 [Didymella exigua CBS 183.55]